MRRLLMVLLVFGIGYATGQRAGTVEKKGQVGTVKLEHVVCGHLTDLNGKYKLSVSEVVYDPGGYIGEHHHAGPGIRMVTAGELSYTEGGNTVVYKPGDYFYESGDVVHSAANNTSAPVRLVNFEVLPADWKGGSAIPVTTMSH